MAESYPIQIPSGTDWIPDSSGTSNIGSSSSYFDNVYSNTLSVVPTFSSISVNVFSGSTAVYQSGIQVISGVTTTGNGVSIDNSKVLDIEYINSVTGASFATVFPASNGVVSISGSKVYTIRVQALTSGPADSQTIYFGTLPKAPTTTAAISKVYIRRPGAIIGCEIYSFAGTAGTAGFNWPLYIRKNDTTDFLVATDNTGANERIWSNWNLNGGSGITMASGDYFEIKLVNPAWTPQNPGTWIPAGYVYIQE
jgi:hypothetical protein